MRFSSDFLLRRPYNLYDKAVEVFANTDKHLSFC
nr:MAG TPA: hypothetical protein [Caudoviricetes sp.]